MPLFKCTCYGTAVMLSSYIYIL